MKKLLFLLFAFATHSANSQLLTGDKSFDHCYSITLYDQHTGQRSSVEVDCQNKDSIIRITGDTIALIQEITAAMHFYDSLNHELLDLAVAAVAFTNEVPDYWKLPQNNSKWLAYKATLNRNGFKSVRNEKPKD